MRTAVEFTDAIDRGERRSEEEASDSDSVSRCSVREDFIEGVQSSYFPEVIY